MKGGGSSDVWIKEWRGWDGGGYVMATGKAEVHLFCVQIRIFVIILKAVSNLVPPKKSPFKMSLLRHTCAVTSWSF